jgi:hypothetical protein
MGLLCKTAKVEFISPCLELFFQSLSTAVNTDPFSGKEVILSRCWFTAFPVRRQKCDRSEQFS